MPLTKIELDSAVCKKIFLYIQGRIDLLREKNDTAGIEQFPKNQGGIQALKDIVYLGDKKMITESDYDDIYEDGDT